MRGIVCKSGLAAGLALFGSNAMAATVVEVEPNDTLATAQNIDGAFSLDYSADIESSTLIPHATVLSGPNNGTFDYYGFTVTQAGSRGIFDLDYALDYVGADFDGYLNIFDSSGVGLVANDDASTSLGAGGSVHRYDSFIDYTFANAGSYFVRVGNCCVSSTPNNGSTYQLQASIENHGINSAVPEPATWGMMILGFGAVGGGMRSAKRRRKVTFSYA